MPPVKLLTTVIPRLDRGIQRIGKQLDPPVKPGDDDCLGGRGRA